jgi:hypothetical protein
MVEYMDKLPRRINVSNDMISGLSYISNIYYMNRDEVASAVILDWIKYVETDSINEVYNNIDKSNKYYYIEITVDNNLWKIFKKACSRKGLKLEDAFGYALSKFLNNIHNNDKDYISKGYGIRLIDRFTIKQFKEDMSILSDSYDYNDGYFVYIIYNKDNNMCYIGRAAEIYTRIKKHILNNTLGFPITDVYVYGVDRFIDSCILERYLIENIEKCKRKNIRIPSYIDNKCDFRTELNNLLI